MLSSSIFIHKIIYTLISMYLIDTKMFEYIIGASRSFFGHGQCQAGTSGDIIAGV